MFAKVMISIIAVNQILLGFSWLAIGISVVFTPLFFFFGVLGIINAFLLLFRGIISEMIALAWHLLFVGYILIRFLEVGAIPESQKLIGWWAVIDLVSVIYLSKITVDYLQTRNKSSA